ncbi:hypothetical protein [Paracoccus sp. (in: a-proteobacteria)]|uniref:hypothetical protein n=1 Tax=Paracoccus sp. TaxID=267 RepID=UPI00322073ED
MAGLLGGIGAQTHHRDLSAGYGRLLRNSGGCAGGLSLFGVSIPTCCGIDLSTGLRLDHKRITDWNGNRLTGASANATLSHEFAEGYEVFAGASRSWLGFDIGEYGLLHARTADFSYNGDESMPSGGAVAPVGQLATLFVDQEIAPCNLKFGGSIEWAGMLSTDETAAAGFSAHDSCTVVNGHGEWRPQNCQNIAVHPNDDNLFDETHSQRPSYMQLDRRGVQPLFAPAAPSPWA